MHSGGGHVQGQDLCSSIEDGHYGSNIAFIIVKEKDTASKILKVLMSLSNMDEYERLHQSLMQKEADRHGYHLDLSTRGGTN